MERKEVNLLWSGGWDGTFRFLQLMQYPNIVIQPVYVIDRGRGSTEIEQKRMRKIIHEAVQRFPGKVRKIKFYDKEWILENCKNDEISEAHRSLREEYGIGTQYEWFALLLNYLGIQAETAMLVQPGSTLEKPSTEEGELKVVEDEVLGNRYFFFPAEGKKRGQLVFGNVILPLAYVSKKDIERMSEENGWMDIMGLSWFCHTPINGEPCGMCVPCNDVMKAGLEWRMPEAAQRRYRHQKFYKYLRKVKNKLSRKRA